MESPKVYSSKDMLPVTGVIIAQNEQKYIEKAIRNLMPNVREVVIIDGGSTDDTLNIATRLGCRIEHRPFAFDFADQRNFAAHIVKTPWVLWLDADEYFEPAAYDIIPSLILNPPKDHPNMEVSAYQFYRISTFDGNRVDDGNDFQWRLQKIDSCRWKGKVHEGLVFDLGHEGRKVPKEFVLHHNHSMARQIYNNALYKNVNEGINKRPEPTEGAQYDGTQGRWIAVETDRDA